MSLADRVRQALRSEPALPPLEGDLPEERAIASVTTIEIGGPPARTIDANIAS